MMMPVMIPEITLGHGISNISMDNGQGVIMYGDSLIPGDIAYSDDFFVHFPLDVQEVNIMWKLLSRHYSTEGSLKIVVNDDIMYDVAYNKEMAGREEVTDFIETEEIHG